jgi:hypothetical protein
LSVSYIRTCNIFIIDASDAMSGALTDKEISTKLKRKLDEDPELNIPSVIPSESIINYFT